MVLWVQRFVLYYPGPASLWYPNSPMLFSSARSHVYRPLLTGFDDKDVIMNEQLELLPFLSSDSSDTSSRESSPYSVLPSSATDVPL